LELNRLNAVSQSIEVRNRLIASNQSIEVLAAEQNRTEAVPNPIKHVTIPGNGAKT